MYMLVTYGILGVLSLLSLKIPKEKYKKIETIVLAAVCLFIMFRYSAGHDYYSYRFLFQRYQGQTLHYALTFGQRGHTIFNVILLLFGKITSSYEVFRILLNIIFSIILFYLINKHSKNKILSAMLLIGSGVFEIYYSSGLKQMIAMTCFFFGYYEFLKKNKPIPYLILAIISAGCHIVGYVSFLVIIFYYLYPWIKKHNYINFIIMGLSILLSVYVILGFPGLFEYLPDYFKVYFTDTKFSIIGLALRVVLLGNIILLYMMAEKKKLDNFTEFSVYICFLSFFLYVAVCSASVMSRISDYIGIIELILIPELWEAIADNKKKIFIFICFFAVNFVLLISDIKENLSGGYNSQSLLDYPYVSIFKPQDLFKYYYIE